MPFLLVAIGLLGLLAARKKPQATASAAPSTVALTVPASVVKRMNLALSSLDPSKMVSEAKSLAAEYPQHASDLRAAAKLITNAVKGA